MRLSQTLAHFYLLSVTDIAHFQPIPVTATNIWFFLTFSTPSETNFRFSSGYLLFSSISLVLIYYFRLFTIGLFTIFIRSLSVCLTLPVCLPNLVMLYFCTTSETDVRFVSGLFTTFVRSLSFCLLLVSVLYRFVYTSFLCVYLISLFCIFETLAKRMSVLLVVIYYFHRFAIGLFTTFVGSLSVC